MRRRVALLLILGLVLTGCAPPPPPSPNVPTVTVKGWHEGGGPSYPIEGLLVDTPTYIGARTWAGPYPISDTGWARPFFNGMPYAPAILPRLAANLEATGNPEVPEDVPAVLAGVLDGGHYVYVLTGYPPEGDDGGLVYSLHKGPDGWTATKLCRGAWRWVWSGTQSQTHDPVVICASIEGSGAHLNLLAYAGDRQVLWFGGLLNAAIDVQPDPGGGPPVIVAYGDTRWGDWRGEPAAKERYTFAFKDGAYTQVAHERQEDWGYHLARLITFLGINQPEKAAGEFAEPPPGGVQAYLEREAPGFIAAAHGRLYATADVPGEVRLAPPGQEGGPGYLFAVDDRGRVLSIGKE